MVFHDVLSTVGLSPTGLFHATLLPHIVQVLLEAFFKKIELKSKKERDDTIIKLQKKSLPTTYVSSKSKLEKINFRSMSG